MKKILVYLVIYILLLFGLNNVSAYNYPNVDNLLKNFYSRLGWSGLKLENKVSKLKNINDKIDYIKNLKSYKLSDYNKDILIFIQSSINNKMYYYKYMLNNSINSSFPWFVKKNLIKDLWNWFKLSQTLDNSFLYYNWTKIYSWSNLSEKLPFIWDEWCDMLSEKFYKIWNNINAKIKQNTWDSLWEENRKKCLRENYYNTLSISNIDDIFFTINKAWYEWKSKIIFNSNDNSVIDRIKVPLDTINRIDSGKSGIYILYHGDRWNSWGLIFIDKITNKVRFLFSNTDLERSNIDYKDIIEFKLMVNKQIKIFYKWQNLEKKELIIKI